MDSLTELPQRIHILEADSIRLDFGGRLLLRDIYFKVQTGDITGLLGRNGTGKSCLLQILFGSRTAQQQSIRVNGHYIGKPFRQDGLIAYLPQRPFIPGFLTIQETFSLYKTPWHEAVAFFPEFEPILRQRFTQLSGGQRRLLEVLLLLTSPARFVLLDEPFAGIMPLYMERLLELMLQVKHRKGIALSDHRYRDVLAVSDTVYLLTTNGRSILLTSPEQQLQDLGYTP